MLEYITITNFQKHAQLHIDFDPLVTVLVGETDSGKSAVLRAIRWLVTNKPSGTSFLKHGTDDVSVILGVDGHVVERRRGGGYNTYLLDGSDFHAFNQGVPDEISKILNISPVSMQSQLDPPFLFLLTSGDVSRELNSVVNLDSIDSILANLAAEQKRAKTTVQIGEERLATAKERLEEMKWVVDADEALVDVEGHEALFLVEEENVAALSSLEEGLVSLQEEQQGLEDFVAQLERVIESGQDIDSAQEEVDALERLLGETITTKKQLNAKKEEQQELEEEIHEGTEGKCPLCGMEGGAL